MLLLNKDMSVDWINDKYSRDGYDSFDARLLSYNTKVSGNQLHRPSFWTENNDEEHHSQPRILFK